MNPWTPQARPAVASGADGRTLEQLEAHTFGVQLIEDRSGRFIVLPKGRKVADGWTVGDKPALKLIEE